MIISLSLLFNIEKKMPGYTQVRGEMMYNLCNKIPGKVGYCFSILNNYILNKD